MDVYDLIVIGGHCRAGADDLKATIFAYSTGASDIGSMRSEKS